MLSFINSYLLDSLGIADIDNEGTAFAEKITVTSQGAYYSKRGLFMILNSYVLPFPVPPAAETDLLEKMAGLQSR